MNRLFKLIHMEVYRFRHILAALMAVTFICQFGAMIWTVLDAVSARKEAALRNETITNGSAFFPGDDLSFAWFIFITQFWFILPVLITIAVLVLYVFWIWYRDWFGRDTFIYRLLMLPTPRRHIYLAKLSAILIFVFSMISWQLLLLFAAKIVFHLMVPSQWEASSPFSDAISANQAFVVLMPHRFEDFILYYGLGILGVLLAFTAVLIERSYRRIGLVYAALYVAVSIVVFLLPVMVLGVYQHELFFYPSEIFLIELGTGTVIAILSVWLSFKLLNNKITV